MKKKQHRIVRPHLSQEGRDERDLFLRALGIKVDMLRMRGDYSMAYVSEKAGITVRAYQKIRQGVDVKISTLWSVCTAMGVELSDFFGTP